MQRSSVVVITGASAGIGRAIAHAFAERGASIGLIARGEQRLDETAREVKERGGRALVLPMDVADAHEMDQAALAVQRAFGDIDIWVNNAMTSVFSRVSEMQPREYRRVTEVTYLGVVHGTLTALRHMQQRDEGCIIQIGSALAYRAIPLQSAYCAAKHAIVGFTDSLRCELLARQSKIRLTIVHLPGMNTPQFQWVKSRLPRTAQPVKPIFQPELAADAVVYASEHSRREIFLGMPTLKAVIGQRIAPGLLDRYLARTAIAGQQTSESENPNRAHNLWNPVAGSFGAHGRFDDQAHTSSVQWWLSKNRDSIAAAALSVAGIGLAAYFLNNGRPRRITSPREPSKPSRRFHEDRAFASIH